MRRWLSGAAVASLLLAAPAAAAPGVSDFHITRTVFRVGGLGTVLKFSLSEDARVTIRFDRRVDDRFRPLRRTMSFDATAGAHSLRFRGRFDLKHPLKPGRYRMTLTARNAAGTATAQQRPRFRLLPPKPPDY